MNLQELVVRVKYQDDISFQRCEAAATPPSQKKKLRLLISPRSFVRYLAEPIREVHVEQGGHADQGAQHGAEDVHFVLEKLAPGLLFFLPVNS